MKKNAQHYRFACRLISVALLLCTLLACAGGEADSASGEEPYVKADDLAEIQQRGTLRILFPRQTSGSLPRQGSSFDEEIALAERYAEEQGLRPVRIFIESREQLIPMLLEGKGDFIAANLTATVKRKEQVSFTVPIEIVREQLVTRADDLAIKEPADLIGRRVALRRSSSYMDTLQKLQRSHQEILFEIVPENIDTEEIIHRVATGKYDITLADSNVVESVLEYSDKIRAPFAVSGDRAIAWAVRPGSKALLASLNRFLTESRMLNPEGEQYLGDLDKIEKRKVLRVLTRNSASTYFLWRGRLQGFEYDLAKAFAERQNLRLEMVVPPVGDDLLSWLLEGKGDLVAASLTPTDERRELGAAFSRPYNYVSQVVVTRAFETDLHSLDDLAGRKLYVRRSSSYWEALDKLLSDGVELDVVAVNEELSTEEIIDKVATGEFDLTLADSHIVELELNWRDDIRNAFSIGHSVPHAWAVRKENPQLLAAINRFLKSEYKGLFYNVKYDRYFNNQAKIFSDPTARSSAATGFSPFDELVKKYAEQYDFDWRLIVSQMYQESRFDPQAQSFAGAQGLMQLLPETAEELGFQDLHDPEIGIHAGVKYLDWVRDRFDPHLAIPDRMWFTLAAYNAGHGHVRDARRLAAQQGLNPNQWFGNVEQAMLLLSRPQYAQEARHGYVRGHEPVRYVHEIRQRYMAYAESFIGLEQ